MAYDPLDSQFVGVGRTLHRHEKRCSKCDQTKPHEEFNRHRNQPDGLQHWCRACERIYQRPATFRCNARKSIKRHGLDLDDYPRFKLLKDQEVI